MPLSGNGASRVPPGFRFHPTDEELLYYYLKKKVSCETIDLDVIKDVDLNKLEPWDLHERCKIGSAPENEWYFFSHKDKKYPTGTRTNRATAAGFWKATGRDKSIHMNFKRIGMRKTLVFYTGRAPRGQKTEWIMHEYRLTDNENPQGDEDGWVVCRVFKKRFHQKGHHGEGTVPLNYEIERSIPMPELHCPSQGAQLDQRLYSEQDLRMQYYGNCTQHQFMQLPQLESPKLAHCNPIFSAPNIKRFLESFSNVHPPPVSIDQHMTQMQVSTQSKLDTANEFTEERSNDWTLLDGVLASQLNHEDATKEIKYAVPQAVAAFNAVQPPARATNRYAHHDYSGCEIDLWNFGK